MTYGTHIIITHFSPLKIQYFKLQKNLCKYFEENLKNINWSLKF